MSDDFSYAIKIPCDNDGFVLLQCPRCGEPFKLQSSDYESDTVLEVTCPCCGISSENYLTQDVIDLALCMAKNQLALALHAGMKKMERETKGSLVELKAGKTPSLEEEYPLKPSIDSLSMVSCNECGGQSKISKLLAMSAFTCPLCGVTNFNDR